MARVISLCTHGVGIGGDFRPLYIPFMLQAGPPPENKNKGPGEALKPDRLSGPRRQAP